MINGDTANPDVSLHIVATDAIKIPIGTTAERPTANAPSYRGYIRYNTDKNQFEGFGNDNAWKSLEGTIDQDQDTYITAENVPG